MELLLKAMLLNENCKSVIRIENAKIDRIWAWIWSIDSYFSIC